jgi:hypothetical protein
MSNETLLLLCAIGALLGIMLFFAFAVAPTVFRSLPAEHAGTYLRAIFPRYYLWGIIFTIITAAIAIEVDTNVFTTVSVIAILFIFSRQILVPAINVARDAKLAGEDGAVSRFKRLHLVSVLINLSQMLMLVGCIIYLTNNG